LNPGGFIQFSFSNLGNGEALARIFDQHRFTKELMRNELTGSFDWQAFRVRPID
jgi:hypothetical protein